MPYSVHFQAPQSRACRVLAPCLPWVAAAPPALLPGTFRSARCFLAAALGGRRHHARTSQQKRV